MIQNPQPQVVMSLERKKEWYDQRNKPFKLRYPVLLFPSAEMRGYQALVSAVIRDLHLYLEQDLFTRLPQLLTKGQLELGTKLDADADDEFKAIINGIKLKFGQRWTLKRLEDMASRVGYRVSNFNKGQNDKVFNQLLSVDVFRSEPWLRNTMKTFASQNASLITNLSNDTIKNVETIVYQGFRQGLSHGTVSERLQDKLKLSKNRADLIARDQINKLNGQLSMVRQTEMGVTRYRWITALDERVRPDHASKQGRIYKWSEPPDIGHPGEPINCRCYAEPVLEDLVGLD